MERLTRRKLFGAVGAFAGGAALASVASVGAGAALVDPVVTLGARRRALYAEADRMVGLEDALMLRKAPAEEQNRHSNEVQKMWRRVGELDEQIVGMVAKTPAGVAEQVEVLRDFLTRTDFEPAIDNMITGLRALATGGAS